MFRSKLPLRSEVAVVVADRGRSGGRQSEQADAGVVDRDLVDPLGGVDVDRGVARDLDQPLADVEVRVQVAMEHEPDQRARRELGGAVEIEVLRRRPRRWPTP